MTTPVDGDGPRWVPRTLGGSVYVVVVAMTLLGLVLTFLGSWRTGVTWMGAALLVGAAARAVLSERGAGMLRVRRRWSDVGMLVLADIALVVLAVVVPEQPL